MVLVLPLFFSLEMLQAATDTTRHNRTMDTQHDNEHTARNQRVMEELLP